MPTYSFSRLTPDISLTDGETAIAAPLPDGVEPEGAVDAEPPEAPEPAVQDGNAAAGAAAAEVSTSVVVVDGGAGSAGGACGDEPVPMQT